MNLKSELITWMEHPQLRDICRELEVPADLRSRGAMQEALTSARRAKPERLITRLDDDQMRGATPQGSAYPATGVLQEQQQLLLAQR